MTTADIIQATDLLRRAAQIEAAATCARGGDRLHAAFASRKHPTAPDLEYTIFLDPIDGEAIGAALDAIAKRIRGKAAALLVGPVEVGQ